MDDIQSKLVDALRWAAERLRKSDLPTDRSAQMQQLASDVEAKCLVAVVGRAKAGKSTFVNALLGEDLAKMGVRETTATINYFSDGKPENPDLPVRCYWRTGNPKVSNVSYKFVDDLQSNKEDRLSEAANIDHLEYLTPRPFLQHITLVDTPGTLSAVGGHEMVINQFMNVQGSSQEGQRNHNETVRLGSAADAVIYLIGATPRSTDEKFLKDFMESAGDGSRSYKAIGIMAQIDLSEELIKRSKQLAEHAAAQLESRLYTVIPVSAAIERALHSLLAEEKAGLKRLMALFRPDPPLEDDFLEALLSDSQAYDEFENFFPGTPCPLTPEQRAQVRGRRAQPGSGEPDEIPWEAFVTLVRTVADRTLQDSEAVEKRLREISGFDTLRNVLEQHFYRRASLLHCYNIVNQALKLLKEINDVDLRAYERRQEEDRIRQERFLAFLRRMPHDPVARELEDFVKERLFSDPSLEKMLQELELEITRLKYELEDYNEDFNALKTIEEYPSLFTEEEKKELKPLFDQHNLDPDRLRQSFEVTLPYIEDRQAYWESKLPPRGRNPIIGGVAQQALRLYGRIAEALVQGME